MQCAKRVQANVRKYNPKPELPDPRNRAKLSGEMPSIAQRSGCEGVAGFRIWGVVFRVWGLGFRILGGFGV